MIDLHLVGIGMGNSEHLTRQALRALEDADLLLLPRKGADKAALADLRRVIAADIGIEPSRITEFDMPVRDADAQSYLGGVNDWHDAIAALWRKAIEDRLPNGGRVALMIWGDPSLYDSSLRIADRIRGVDPAFTVHVVPGITSLQLLTAAHAIPLNTLAGSILVTTGRRLREDGWPANAETVAVMLDGQCSFRSLKSEGIHIWWGAYLGMEGEVLIDGPLAEQGQEIVERRKAERERAGWIMDTYVLRKSTPT